MAGDRDEKPTMMVNNDVGSILRNQASKVNWGGLSIWIADLPLIGQLRGVNSCGHTSTTVRSQGFVIGFTRLGSHHHDAVATITSSSP